MKKNELKFENLKMSGVEKEARMVPIVEGDILNFTLSEDLTIPRKELVNGVTQEWTDIKTDSDVAISATQITRRNNGLTLTGKSIKERLKSFVDLFSDEGTLTLKVSKVIDREFIDKDGSKSTARYLKFEIV